jgi:hypothetical protein
MPCLRARSHARCGLEPVVMAWTYARPCLALPAFSEGLETRRRGQNVHGRFRGRSVCGEEEEERARTHTWVCVVTVQSSTTIERTSRECRLVATDPARRAADSKEARARVRVLCRAFPDILLPICAHMPTPSGISCLLPTFFARVCRPFRVSHAKPLTISPLFLAPPTPFSYLHDNKGLHPPCCERGWPGDE